MANVKVIPYSEYGDKRTWKSPFSDIDPDTAPHTLPPVTKSSDSIEWQHRAWHCIQYFNRRGYNIPATMNRRKLFELRLSKNGGLVDSRGRLVIPANSQTIHGHNYIEFRWDARRIRWGKRTFEVDGKKHETVEDIFEAAIAKANSSIKPYDITYDRRVKLVSFQRWLFEYTKGAVDIRNKTRQIQNKFSSQKLKDAPRRMSLPRATKACLMYPMLTKDASTFATRFQRPDDPDFFRGVCYRILYGTEPIHSVELVSNFMVWNNRRRLLGWLDYLSQIHWSPQMPSDQSQQTITSNPVCVGRFQKRAAYLVMRFQPTTLYGMINSIHVDKQFYVFRDLSYPSRTFPYIPVDEMEFTEEDYQWNIPDVFTHRMWDPYQLSNWEDNKLFTQLRAKNAKHVRQLIRKIRQQDPTYFERRTESMIPDFIPTQPKDTDN